MLDEKKVSALVCVCREVGTECGIPTSVLVANTNRRGAVAEARREAMRRALTGIDDLLHAELAEFFGVSVRRVRKSELFGSPAGFASYRSARMRSASLR
jgi:hypothetical protein